MRRVFGEKNGNAKLTEEQVRWIRANYVRYSHSRGALALARKLNVTGDTVQRIVDGINWAHVD